MHAGRHAVTGGTSGWRGSAATIVTFGFGQVELAVRHSQKACQEGSGALPGVRQSRSRVGLCVPPLRCEVLLGSLQEGCLEPA